MWVTKCGGIRQMAYGRRQIAKHTVIFLLIWVIVWDLERGTMPKKK
jgi:hypothetical protein